MRNPNTKFVKNIEICKLFAHILITGKPPRRLFCTRAALFLHNIGVTLHKIGCTSAI